MMISVSFVFISYQNWASSSLCTNSLLYIRFSMKRFYWESTICYIKYDIRLMGQSSLLLLQLLKRNIPEYKGIYLTPSNQIIVTTKRIILNYLHELHPSNGGLFFFCCSWMYKTKYATPTQCISHNSIYSLNWGACRYYLKR